MISRLNGIYLHKVTIYQYKYCSYQDKNPLYHDKSKSALCAVLEVVAIGAPTATFFVDDSICVILLG